MVFTLLARNTRSTGYGNNEVYMTQAEDNELGSGGSLFKVLNNHNLDQFPTMRNRLVRTLKSVMFRLVHDGPLRFVLHHVDGPWVRHTRLECLKIVDMN